MNKTVLITGASRGIGAAIAKTFAEAGYGLALCCRNSMDELEDLAQKLRTSYRYLYGYFRGMWETKALYLI